MNAPIIYQIKDNKGALKKLQNDLEDTSRQEEKTIMLEYPTVYIHDYPKCGEYEVYIGESNNIVQRTFQHFDLAKDMSKWEKILNNEEARLFIIGHEHFNKSLTLDIENRLMLYLSSVSKVRKIYNRRGNQQNKYYTSSERDKIFQAIWKELRDKDKELFPEKSEIIDSAIYKASPLHQLFPEQEDAKQNIIEKVKSALKQGETGQVIFVSGEAGTGKTVLNSSLFYELCTYTDNQKMSCHLLVNHKEQLTVYEQIAEKLNLGSKKEPVVWNPTKFINQFSNKEVDVVFVDEAHLLWTQGKQAYRGKNQLFDLQKIAKVVIIMFDQNQILRSEQYWEYQMVHDLETQARLRDNYFKLKNQHRINADNDTVEWIRNFTKKKSVDKIPTDKHYEIKIFDTPAELQNAIYKKAKEEKTGLSRLIATFDWEYKDETKSNNRLKKYWEIAIDYWKMPWNLQIQDNPEEVKKNKKLAWAEKSQTIDEVGSTFTIQGFDLNYAGVILGPSVKYRNGKIEFHPECSKNEHAKQARTLSDGTKRKFGETLIQNEVNILMTRGVDGLYIYAQDEALREALQKAAM